jgi:hypothetical protein
LRLQALSLEDARGRRQNEAALEVRDCVFSFVMTVGAIVDASLAEKSTPLEFPVSMQSDGH